jgi:hypothetical protein
MMLTVYRTNTPAVAGSQTDQNLVPANKDVSPLRSGTYLTASAITGTGSSRGGVESFVGGSHLRKQQSYNVLLHRHRPLLFASAGTGVWLYLQGSSARAILLELRFNKCRCRWPNASAPQSIGLHDGGGDGLELWDLSGRNDGNEIH